MSTIGEVALKVRSKNAGPFWLTVDIFCGSDTAFEKVRRGLDGADLPSLFQTADDKIKRFDIEDLKVVKLSLPRPAVQGTVQDRDMHGASFAQIVHSVPV